MDEFELDNPEQLPQSEACPEADIPAPKKEKKKKKRWVRILLIVLCVLLAIALVVAIVATVMVYRWLNMINRTDGFLETMSSSEMEAYLQSNTDPSDPDFTGEVLDPDDIIWETTPQFQQSEHIVNILLIGSDTRVPGARARSDSLILCTFDPKTKTLTMTSLLRDMYLPIPGYQSNRINASFAFGGIRLLNKTIETNFGIEIHGNFVIDFTGFADVIDVIGGVEITMTGAEANYMNTYAVESARKGSFQAGTYLLDGYEALTYARMRKIDSDFGRAQRQRTVINSAFGKCKNLSATQLYRLLDQVLPLMTTDMSNSQILGLAGEVIPIMSQLTIKTQHIPANGTYRNAWVGNMLVLMPDLEANRRILWSIMGE